MHDKGYYQNYKFEEKNVLKASIKIATEFNPTTKAKNAIVSS